MFSYLAGIKIQILFEIIPILSVSICCGNENDSNLSNYLDSSRFSNLGDICVYRTFLMFPHWVASFPSASTGNLSSPKYSISPI